MKLSKSLSSLFVVMIVASFAQASGGRDQQASQQEDLAQVDQQQTVCHATIQKEADAYVGFVDVENLLAHTKPSAPLARKKALSAEAARLEKSYLRLKAFNDRNCQD